MTWRRSAAGLSRSVRELRLRGRKLSKLAEQLNVLRLRPAALRRGENARRD